MINHYDIHSHSEVRTQEWLSGGNPVKIILTSGASCPDAILDEVLQKILSYFPGTKKIDEALEPFRIESKN